ncbi:FAD-binding oxidoreductase [Chloroflexus aggregans]|jgi:glycolate oxidase|uniref:FAD linked oxidase domain protein n=1 Tax=Chloroflexus aggregans (strain MD-66 / DSM 9485) TaxID=326427 RepID=B8G9E4_CHLAD|nr:FAD-linked oxidase C-terminal domain-containing protein [Chloroflexus aggregans]ACL24434.1 FAD linked oxidase domain protein [Chloroflexus aggregans DSM 9485]
MNRAELIAELERILGPRGVVTNPDALLTYDADGCVMDTHEPHVVTLPTSAEQVAAIVRLAARAGMPIVPRGAGTGLAGGATPMQGGIVISTARMDKILQVDTANGRVLCQPGVINWELSQYLKPFGYQFAPDPSSQKACTIGGNIANNSGGPHCLKYGITASHVLAVQVVLPDGSIVWTGDGSGHTPGYDLTGVITGSEGTIGFVTAAWLRLTRLPEAVRVVLALFPDIAGASNTVSQVIASGLLPAALEIMDRLAIKAVNDMYKLGLPEAAGAALLIEVDGVEDGLDELLHDITAICWRNGAIDVRPARTLAEQNQVWAARKNAFGAMGRLAPTYYLVDTVVPRTKLPQTMDEVGRISREFRLPIANVFHAGDGNLHPIILFDRRDRSQNQRALEAATSVMKVSIDFGGVISGEHGIGVEKQDYMTLLFTTEDLAAMAGLHQSFDPHDLFNPGKVFPKGRGCGELAALRRAGIAWSTLKTS